MQNFTFGRKGTNWFLFAFVMLIGTLPSFGQCPTTEETDAAQTFCYLQTVGEIDTDGDAIYQTADIENDTQPIPDTEYLASGSYYVGSTTEECTTRIEVVVTVNSGPRPVNLITNTRVSGFEFTNCASETFSAGNLEDLFTNDTDYGLEVYDSEFGTTPMNPADNLQAGESYFVGQVYTGTGTECPSLRTAVRFNPSSIEGPTATSPQTFCEGATVADLEATGTYENTQAIRWYRSANGIEHLPETTELINGQTYYAGQIVNDSNSPVPPCETPSGLDSEDNPFRTPVTVEVITFDAGDDSLGNEICQADLDARIDDPNETAQDILLSFKDDIDFDFDSVSFDPTPQSIYTDYLNEPIQTFTTTATFVTAEGCEDDVVIEFTVNESYDAGDDNTEGNEVCLSTDVTEQEVGDYLTSLLSDGVDAGTFSNIPQITDDIQNGLEGPFNSTYTAGTGSCLDTAEFEFTVLESPNLQQYALDTGVTEVPLCNAEIPGLINSVPQDVIDLYMELIPGAPTGGTFTNMTINEIVTAYNQNNFQTFETTYTVTADNGCSDSIVLSYTIIEGETANSGTFAPNNPYCSNEEPIDLTTLQEDDEATMGGTFTGEGVEGNFFDPSSVEPGTYDITYTVNESIFCVEGTDETTFTIEVIQGPNAGQDISGPICITELEDIIIANAGDNEAIINALFDRFNFDGEQGGTIQSNLGNDYNTIGTALTTYYADPNRDPSITMEGEYTVGDPQDECGTDVSNFSITINDTQDAYAGEITGGEVCEGDDPINLNDYLIGSGAMMGGTFTLDGEVVEDDIFDPSTGIDSYNFIYTVDDTAECVTPGTFDEEDFTIIVNEEPYAGEDITGSICITELEGIIASSQGDSEVIMETLFDRFDFDGETGGSIESNEGDIDGIGAALLAYYSNEDRDPSITIEGEYTVGDPQDLCGTDVSNFSITINDIQVANAGENVELTFCVSQGDFDLRDYLSDDANPNGNFEDFDGMINTSDLGEGEFTYTYVVDETVDCVTEEASVEFTVNIIGDLNAGTDKSTSICNANIEDGMFPNSTSVRDYYLNMLDEGVSRDGTFSPSIQDLVNWYNNTSEIGEFTTTYTISEGECSDSAVLSVTVYESIPAEIDPIDPVTLCSIDEDQDMFSFLPEGADTNGYFEGYEDGIFSPSTTGAGEFEVTYTLDETSPCVTGEASATFTITVLETVTAGEDMTASFCATDGEQDLFNFLDAEASADGEFTYNDEVLVDGMFDASTMGIGSYEVTYTVEPINECGVATSTLTVTVNEVPDAPAAPELDAFCAIDMATGAELPVAEGQNWYADAELTTMVAAEDMLEDGAYYLTVTSENGCESEATVVTVSVNDSPAPTISSTNLEFCDADNPTIAELTAEIVESGEITWYGSEDGTNALGTTTTLTSGTYYATLTGETGCESSQRLAVTVSVENCPILYPEAITPNGDGRNDTFIVENITNEYPNYSIEIFNRWGNVIYKGNASTPAWDGTSNQSGSFGDDVLPVGVYFYVIDFSDGSTEPKQGKVYLSR